MIQLNKNTQMCLKINIMEFEKKFVIVGNILFNDSDAEIISISEDKMLYDEESFEKFMDKIEDEGRDYIILPDYKCSFIAISNNCLESVERIKKMATDVGWSDY